MELLNKILWDIPDKKAIIKFSLLIFLTEFVRGAYLTFLPLYGNNILNHSVAIIGMVVCAFFLAETLSMIIIGWILDRFNNRIVLILGLLISLVSLIFLNFKTSPIFLILNGALYGLGFAPVWIIVLGYITSFSQDKRALCMGIIYSSWLAGLGLGGVTASFLIGRSYMLALLVLIILWGVCIFIGFFIKEGIMKKETARTGYKTFVSTFKRLVETKFLIPGMIFQTFSITILVPIVPIYITSNRFVGLSTDQYGIILGTIGIVTVICMITFGAFTKKIGIQNLFVFGLFFTAVGILGIGNMSSIITIFIFGMIIGISYSAVLPAWNGILSNNIKDEDRGLMWGSFSTIEGIGRAFGALAGGVLSKSFSLQFSFNISALMILGLAGFYFYLSKKKVLN